MTEKNILAKINQYFDKVYVLSLPRATKRHENLNKVLDGLEWRFFWGTDKLDLDQSTLTSDGVYDDKMHRQTKRTHRSMSLAEVACALSHRRIHQDILDNGYKNALILEDDVLPQLDRISQFLDEAEQLPDDWELLMLGYYGHKLPTLKYRLQQQVYRLFHRLGWFNWDKVSITLINQLCMQDYSEDWYRIGKVLGAHAYAVSAQGAKKFVDYQTPIILQADRIYSYYGAESPLKAFAPKHTFFTLSELSKESFIQT